MVFAIFLVHTVFLVLYIWADGAWLRPFSFNLWRYVLSAVTGILLSLAVADILTPENRR